MPLLAELLGESPGIVAVRAKLGQLLGHQASPRRLPPVLLQGETGTGKGLVARLIHREGPRRQGPFVGVNCAAIPETLLEAELFGFERGAFTDARQAKPGLFQSAHRGILFLDEVSLLPPALQPKLLKVIEEQAVRRLGSTRSEPVDVWVLAASSEELAAAVNARGFRKDLYHRLAVPTVSLPPLRERTEDIPPLAEHLLARVCVDYGLARQTLAPDARAALLGYGWPGNVRELSNVLERAALLADAPMITAASLALASTAVTEPTASDPVAAATQEALGFDDAVAGVECQRLLDALRATNGNVTRAATRLGISRNRLRYRIEKYGLRPRAPSPRQRASHRQPSPSAFAETTVPRPETTPPSPLRWDHRHVALLRVALVFESQADVPPDTSRELELLSEKARSFGGRVQELGPREIVAAFGLEPVEDAPNRAALAAMAIQKAGARALALDSAGPGVKLAVHVARLMVGRLGGHPQIELDDMSDAVTTLNVLIAAGEADTIVVSEAAIPFLERRFEFVRGDRPAGAAPGPYRLTRREPTGFGLGGRALSRFVGRDQELQILGNRLTQVEQGHGQVVGVLGEPGVGKSRLVYEFTRLARVRPWRTLASRAVSYGTTTPYLPIVDLLKHYFQIEDGEAPIRIRERVTEKVLGLDGALEPHVPALVSLLDVTLKDHQWQSLEPLYRRERTLDSIKRLLIRESHVQPLCLVLEDLHWIDTETQAALDRLIESLPAARILLLVTYRPEYQSGWGSKTYSTQLRLDPLDPERTEELLTMLVGENADLSPLKRLLIERTEGNPFFLEESVRALVETKALVGERAAYMLATSVDAIHARIVEAIERLDADRLVEHVEVLAHHSFRGEIWEKAFLYLRQAGMKAARRSANREAVTHFEQALVALKHLPEGRDRVEQAIDVRFELRRAFLALGEYPRMLGHLRDAEVLAQALGDRRRLAWALVYLAGCHHWMGDTSDQLDCEQRALTLADELMDCDLQAVGPAGLARTQYALGDYRRARALFGEAVLRLGGDVSFARFRPAALPGVFARSGLARCLAQLGQFGDGIVDGEEAVRIAEKADQPFSLVIACLGLGSLHLLKGDLPQAIPVLERAVGFCRRWTIPAWFPTAASSLGYAYVLSGRLGDGVPLLRDAIDQAARMRIGYDDAPTLAWLSEALLLDGRPHEAVSLAQRELDRSRQRGHRGHEAYGLRILAEVAAHLDPPDVETAKGYYDQALTLATELGMRPLVARCHLGLGKLYRRTGEQGQAQEHLTTAASMYREMDMWYWLEKAEAEMGA